MISKAIWLSNVQGVNGTRCLVVTNRQVGEDYSVQAKKVGFHLQNGIRYQGSVALRGNRAGTAYAALSREASPWDNWGLWQPVNLATAWQTIPLDFTVTGNPSPAQVRFSIMLGNFQGSVFIEDVKLWQTASSYLLWTR
ncbi:hypothetical protein U27_01493 [Candidatus Vecturithrix granuli]|uniref:CBM-cenC domain-containing protein n=1 Tax=Vecturithrix granuli TaxID=1499967 RepID=A0A081CAI7_VECG1|nr:hypothetical protein U27_01493 [Candidatus Vecturithrix granuli]